MEPITAMQQTHELVDGLIAGLTPEHREMPTPCDEWTVHDLINHMCGGNHMIATGLMDQTPEGDPGDMPDFLADGPAAGYAASYAALAAAATPDALATTHAMPFGEAPGDMALSVITADHVIHAWDLARATGQQVQISDELAEFSQSAFAHLLPPGDRPDGGGFKSEVPVAADAGAVDRMIGYSGRQP